MEQISDIHYTIFGLLAGCGWVSQSLLGLLDYSYSYRTRALKTLLDKQLIRKSGKGRNKAYALAAKGRHFLTNYNAHRYRHEVMEMTKQLARHPERSVQRGDAAAFLSLGGFSIHPDDKPAFPAYTPPLPDGPGRRNLYRNTQTHRYPGQPDGTIYRRRLTAVNCYYDALFLKELAVDRTGVSYSRACGALLTPSCLPRVYHSRDVAMKFHSTGEHNFQCLLLSPKIFTGYLPEEQNAALIFGADFTAAQHILEYNLAGHSSRMPLSAKKKGGRGYPSWQGFLVREISRGLFPQLEPSRWCFEEGGYTVYILAALNLAQIDLAIQMVQGNSGRKVRIVCLDWQVPLFRQLLEPFAGQRDLWLTKLPAGFVEGLLQREKEYWEGADEGIL